MVIGIEQPEEEPMTPAERKQRIVFLEDFLGRLMQTIEAVEVELVKLKKQRKRKSVRPCAP